MKDRAVGGDGAVGDKVNTPDMVALGTSVRSQFAMPCKDVSNRVII